MAQTFWYKVFNVKYDIVLAACDKELLGKVIRHGKLKFKVGETFYKGNVTDDEGAVRLMKVSTIGNFTGNNIVSIAEREGFVTKENILFIGEVPHAQFVKIE